MVSNFAELSTHQQAYESNKPCEDTQKHFGVGWPRNQIGRQVDRQQFIKWEGGQ